MADFHELGPDMQDARTLARGAGVALPGRVIGRAMAVLTQILLARLLGPAIFGLYSVGYALLRLGELILPLGMDQGVVRFGAYGQGADPEPPPGVLGRGIGVAVLVGVLAGGGLVLLAPYLAQAAFHDPSMRSVLVGIAPALALAAGLQVGASATRLSRRMQYAVLTQDLGQPFLNLILAGLFVWLGWGLRGALGALVASYAAAFTGALLFIKRLFPQAFGIGEMNQVSLPAMLAFSVPASLARIFGSMIMMFDRVVIGFLRPASDVGVYQAASLSASIFPIILISFNAIFAPMIADLHARGERQRLEQVYRLATRWGIYLSLPFYLLMLAAPGEILQGVFGVGYAEGVLPMLILATAQWVSIGVGGVGVLLPMTGHEKPWLRVSAVAVSLHLAASFLLVPRLGIVGGALATGGALLCLYLGGLVLTRRRLGIWPYDARLMKGAWALIAGIAAVILARRISLSDPLLKVILLGVLIAGAVLAALALKGLEPEERSLLESIKDKIWRGRVVSR